MAIDIDSLWDHGSPASSEQRFLAALTSATPEDAFILQTQIARTHGMRRDFVRQRAILAGIEPQLPHVGAEARTRYFLELGRSYASATHTAEQQTPDTRERARHAYSEAITAARLGHLDGLLVDALHMVEFTEPSLEEKLRCTREALAVATSSEQESARRWRASLHNNIGYALHQMGRFDEALVEFESALALRQAQGSAESIRVARWMVAWTLRSLGRLDDALAMQLALEQERATVERPSPYVFAELAELYRAKGDAARADEYAQLKARLDG
ncbi:MAG: tetratricopeptide repeat protein [Vicinamibacterales bacterium]